MSLPTHGRFPYSPITDRGGWTWPGGARLAVYVAVNCEHFAYDDGDTRLGYTPGMRQPDTYNFAWREWGNRVGAFRIAEMFQTVGITPTLLVNSSIYTHAPAVPAAFRALGAEVVAHGSTNSVAPNEQDPDAERATIDEVWRTIAEHEGRPPAGWMSPVAAPSRVTEDLLAQRGFTYTLDWPVDDQPVRLSTASGPLLAVPYPHELNDLPVFVHHHHTASTFEQMIVDACEEMRSAPQPAVLAISLHTFIAGQPHRLRHVRAALAHLRNAAADIWFTTPSAIAQHWSTVVSPG